jgi:hypothetical protein
MQLLAIILGRSVLGDIELKGLGVAMREEQPFMVFIQDKGSAVVVVVVVVAAVIAVVVVVATASDNPFTL